MNITYIIYIFIVLIIASGVVYGTDHSGDGVYILKPHDTVVTDSGYIVKIGDISTIITSKATHKYRPEGELVKRVQIKVYDENNDFIFDIWIEEDTKYSNFSELGINVIAEEIREDEVVMKISSSYKVNFQPGWNLFSVPLSINSEGIDCEDAECYSNTLGLEIRENTCGDLDSLKIWHYNTEKKKYERSQLQASSGYWLNVDKECSIEFAGKSVVLGDLKLKRGWNQIGGPTKSIHINADTKGDCNIISGPWRYNKYMRAFEKYPFLSAPQGYFIKVSDDCTLSQNQEVEDYGDKYCSFEDTQITRSFNIELDEQIFPMGLPYISNGCSYGVNILSVSSNSAMIDLYYNNGESERLNLTVNEPKELSDNKNLVILEATNSDTDAASISITSFRYLQVSSSVPKEEMPDISFPGEESIDETVDKEIETDIYLNINELYSFFTRLFNQLLG